MNNNTWNQELSIPAAAAAEESTIPDMAVDPSGPTEGDDDDPLSWPNLPDGNTLSFDEFMSEIEQNTSYLARDRGQHGSMDGELFLLL